MTTLSTRRLAALVLSLAPMAAVGGEAAGGVEVARFHLSNAWAANVVVPQTRAFATTTQAQAVEITSIDARVVIAEQLASTDLTIDLKNPSDRILESEILMPVPDGAIIRGFDFQGQAKEPTAVILPKEEARRLYNTIVAKVRDPALLEFAGYNMLRSSVFPVPAKGTQRVRLAYEHLLPRDSNRVDYVLPRSEALAYEAPWRISVTVGAKRAVASLYSPSHEIGVQRLPSGGAVANVSEAAARAPGAFRLSFLLQEEGVTASLLAYPDPKVGGGYFLLLAGLPPKPLGDGEAAIKREVILAFDRSGSMRGEKLDQVRAAAMQIVQELGEGERFNIVAYNESVESFAPQPVAKDAESALAAREYLQGIQASGGTNIYDALLESLRQNPGPGSLPLLLFLTDGLPTIGKTSELDIRDLAQKANPHLRRVFTFGVGVDVNTPLLERIAESTRATASFILPDENVGVKVGQIFRRLSGPVFADPTLNAVSNNGGNAAGRTSDLLPSRIPDLYDGDQLVLLGRYVGEAPLRFRLQGNLRGKPAAFSFEFPLDKASTRNAFVPRLWASRKIGVLVDAIRDMGADGGRGGARPNAADDARFKEVVGEIVRLSREFGILTEYTAFFANEGTDLTRRLQILDQACGNFRSRAFGSRSGISSVNQEMNRASQRSQSQLNYDNGYWNERMERVTVDSVRQVGDRAFYRVRNQWVDSSLVDKTDLKVSRTVKYGTPEFDALLQRMIQQGRQACLSVGQDMIFSDEEAGEVFQVTW